MSEKEYEGNRGDYKEKWSHHDIGYLIVATRDYLVYIDKEGDIDWETTQEYDSAAPQSAKFNIEKHNAVVDEAALLEVSPCDGFTAATCQHFKRLIGASLVCCFEFDYSGAKKMLAAAQQFLRARSEETSRYWYVSASIVAWIPFAALGTLAWLIRDYAVAAIGPDAFWLIICISCGGFGALLSVITRAGRLKVESSAGRRLHILEGSSRIGAGAISALLVALAVRSGVILSALTHDHQLHPVMLLAALIAGAGERLAPSIITKFDATNVTVPARADGTENGGGKSR